MRRLGLSVIVVVLFLTLFMHAAIKEVSAAALPTGPYLEPNQKATMGGWEIQVQNGIKWTKEIKGGAGETSQGAGQSQSPGKSQGEAQKQAQTASKKSQDGMVFALVPITVKNTSNRTSSLLIGVWNLYDYTGRMYLLLTVGLDYLPAEDQLNMKDIKPGETRKGYLPFELYEGLDKKDKYLQLIIPLVGVATWRL